MRVGNKNLPLNSLYCFEVTARLLHMGLAAKELSITQSAVSHQIRLIEQSLNVRLFDRANRRLRLTSAGLKLYQVISPAFEAIKSCTLELHDEGVSGPFCIAATPAFTTLWLLPRLPQFMKLFPNVELQLQTMPFPAPSVLPDADFIVQFGHHYWPRRRVVALSGADYLPVCSPKLLKSLAQGGRNSIQGQVLIHDDGGEAWDRWLGVVQQTKETAKGHIYVGNATDALELARMGQGLAINDHIVCSHWLEVGELIQAYPQNLKNYDSYYMITKREDHLTSVAREFESWLRLAIL